MVYDPDTGKVILFGGMAGSRCSRRYCRSDLLTTPGPTTPPPTPGPTSTPPATVPPAREATPWSTTRPRQGDPLRGMGRRLQRYFNDTWAYDPAANTWTNLNPAGDRAVRSARLQAMVYDPATGKVILFGGWDDTDSATSTTPGPTTPPPTPGPSSSPAATCRLRAPATPWSTTRPPQGDPLRGVDEAGNFFNDTWAFAP